MVQRRLERRGEAHEVVIDRELEPAGISVDVADRQLRPGDRSIERIHSGSTHTVLGIARGGSRIREEKLTASVDEDAEVSYKCRRMRDSIKTARPKCHELVL